MKKSVDLMTKNALICAIYVALTMVNPLSYGMFQIRISTMLIPTMFICPILSPGMILGVAIANMNSSLGMIDVIFGVAINCLTAFVVPRIFKNDILRCILYSIIAGIFVSAELYITFHFPIAISFLSVCTSNGIIAIIGLPLVKKIFKHIRF